jgi:hypothetical protein
VSKREDEDVVRTRLLTYAKAIARRWPAVAAVAHRELSALAEALQDPRLDELARLIEDGRLAEARAALAALAVDLGESNPDVVAARWELAVASGPAGEAAADGESVAATTPEQCGDESEDALRAALVRLGVHERHASFAARIAEFEGGGSAEARRACLADARANGAEFVGAGQAFREAMRAAAKPSRVLPGQVWRCVGVDGELVARERVEFSGASADIGLAPVEAPDVTTVRARETDILGLKEWAFVRGPR